MEERRAGRTGRGTSRRLGLDGEMLIKPVVQPCVGEVVPRAVGRPAGGVDFPVGLHDGPFGVNFPHSLPEIPDEFIEGFELFLRRLVVVVVADQAYSEGYVVQVVAVNMASIDLSAPARTNLDLPVAGRGAVSNDKVVGQAVWHFTNIGVVVLESFRIALSGSAVVDHDVTPAGLLYGGLVYLLP